MVEALLMAFVLGVKLMMIVELALAVVLELAVALTLGVVLMVALAVCGTDDGAGGRAGAGTG